jgi:hypothetical protein
MRHANSPARGEGGAAANKVHVCALKIGINTSQYFGETNPNREDHHILEIVEFIDENGGTSVRLRKTQRLKKPIV